MAKAPRQWTVKRLPYKFLEPWKTAESSPPESTCRIFLDHGFKAWVAYFRASTGEGHFRGRGDRRKLIDAVEQLSVEHKRAIARNVATIRPHPSTEGKIMLMEQAVSDQTIAVDSTAAKRRRRDDQPATTDLTQSYSALHEDGQVVEGASIDGLLGLFPEYLSGAIRRDHSRNDRITAAVTMNFPSSSFGEVACIMTLVVQANKVERLAMLLFGAHVESEGRCREIVLQEGARLRPSPQITLQGTHSDAISKVFGSMTATAIAAAPYRRREIREGTRATRCVSMTILNECDATAMITLTLGLEEGLQIKKMLYA
ncbi:hypothetical protein GE09DRAFT_1179690 [Coniochaeta sp. 2T2.1]|nr:hypothetical protein GE09DRAFT_1179690 [Coniochaeta sp. 2T2.1]